MLTILSVKTKHLHNHYPYVHHYSILYTCCMNIFDFKLFINLGGQERVPVPVPGHRVLLGDTQNTKGEDHF